MSEAAVADIRARGALPFTLSAVSRRHAFSAEVVHGLEGYAQLEADLQRLAAVHPGAVLFQSPALVAGWARHFAARRLTARLATLVLREAGRPVLIWPLSIERHPFITIARGAGAPIAQYDEILIDPRIDRSAAIAAALDALRTSVAPDLIHFERVRADGMLHAALREMTPMRNPEAAPYVDLSGGFPAAVARRPSYAAKQHRKRVKRFLKAGKVAFALAENPAEAEAWLRDALALKRLWLRKNGLLSRAFVRRETGTCLAELAHTLSTASASARMIVGRLSLDGKTAAIEVGFQHRGSFHLYLRAFAPELSCLGPGNVLTERMLEWCAANGIERYDMLAPRSRNKSEWQSGEVNVADYVLPMTWRGRLYAMVPDLVAPVLRDAFYALPLRFRSAVAALRLKM